MGEICDAAADWALPAQIAASTRSLHTALNRSITARLPLCLPPHTEDAQFYYRGISLFGEIYLTFEREWQATLNKLGEDKLGDPRTKTVLKKLYIPSLQRSGRLQADLSRLQQTWPSNRGVGSLQSPLIAEQITENIRGKPHNLIAYSWIMYMALFNGGRWIRSQLQRAGPRFWGSTDLSVSIDCLSFWDFEGGEDGEDIKREFKQRIDEVTKLLSDEERQDVVTEAVRIFHLCQHLVDHLDRTVGSESLNPQNTETMEETAPIAQSSGLWNWIWKLGRLWPDEFWGNDFWLRSDVQVQP